MENLVIQAKKKITLDKFVSSVKVSVSGEVKNILDFDLEQYLKKTEDFLQEKQCVENGSASKKVVDLIENIVSGKNISEN